jgi:predicted Zn finger-like uncharacterized protein
VRVSCPRCGTRYRLPPRSRLGRNPTYRCTRCRHVFAPDEEALGPDLVDEVEEQQDEEPPLETAHEDDDEGPVFVVEPSMRDSDPDDEERRIRYGWSDRPIRGTPARFAVWAGLFVVLVYGVVSIYLYTHPGDLRTMFARIPLIGDEMSANRLNPGNVQLADVHGDFKRVRGDRLVFVITGTAINNAPVPVAGIQIEGRVVGRDEQRQVVYCGAAPQDIGDLGIREIELLQTLKPSNDWSLPPGEQDRFLVAFADPPLPLTEFAAEVVAVRGANRRENGATQ